MAENKSSSRAIKTLQSSKELAKTTRDIAAKEKDKILQIIKNNIIDHRIDEKEAKLRVLTEMYDENEANAINALKSDEALEKKKLSEDYESIVKKQLQMLQADERGKQALLNEISEIKRQQRKRSESLQARKKALLIEKERSKRIAALPPPLPRSVKLLLKEQEKKESEAPPLSIRFFPEELYPVEEVFEDFDNKENMDEDEYHEQRRQMQEEWDRKAKKRFNEAIRKDRQKQEQEQILKEIENAEKINRRQMAKNLSEPSGKVPCTLSDRLNHIEKQAVMEDAVERVFKKSSTTKEHVIEDLEGYEDKWEAKYKRIDSNLEEKMFSCVPSFVKQNYSYLLEEEPAQCGNRFARLDDSSDELNMAYIESPTERTSGSDRITAVISHLDQMMSESNAVYEKEFKPLLEAEILKEGLPRKESFDKAVEANILKLPTEHKAIDAHEETPMKTVVPSASRSTQADFMKSGVMAFKRKSLGSKTKPYLGSLSDSHSQLPSWAEPETAHSGSWSSSSFFSLPSRHGQPDICNLCSSPSCKLPLVEDQSFHRDCIPLAKSHGPPQEDISDVELSSKEMKSKILSYVQLVADKYLKKTPSVEVESRERVGVSLEDEDHPGAIGTPERIISGDLIEDPHRLISGDLTETPDKIISGDLIESEEMDLKEFALVSGADVKQSTSEKDYEKTSQKSKTQQMDLPHIPPYSGKKSESEANKPEQDEFVKRCHEILSEKLSNIFSAEDGESEVLSALKSAITGEASDDKKIKLTPNEFIYHELSTILEMDSALTNDMPSFQDASKMTNASGSSSISSLSRKSDEFISPEEVDTTSASLVDLPISEASELAKNIRFIAESSEKPPDSSAQLFRPHTPFGLISGTLTDIQTPSPRALSEAQDSAKIRIITESPENAPKSGSQELESKSPHRLISGMLTNTQTPSPGQVSEAPRPKSVISEHLATPSKMTLTDIHSDISTPSTSKTKSSYSSRDLVTPTSQLSTPKESDVTPMTHYSSSFRFANLKYPFLTSLKNSDLQEYFRNVSSIKQDSSSSQGESKPSDGKQTVPKTVSSRVPVQQVFFPNDFDGKFGTDENSSTSFRPMTPHSNISSPATMYAEPDNKPTSSKEGNAYQTEHNLPKSTTGLPHSFGSSQGSFKPMTPRTYMSSPIETPGSREGLNAFSSRDLKKSSSRKSIDSQKTDDNNFQPMTPHSYISSNASSMQNNKDFYSNSKKQDKTHSTSRKVGRHFSETENSSNDFQPMATHSHVSTPDYSSQRQQHVESKGNNTNQGKYSTSQKERDWGSAENSTSNFQPMTPHSDISTPNPPSQRHDLVSERKNSRQGMRSTSPKKDDYLMSAENSECGFQPMTTHSNISTPNLPSQRHDLVSERKNSRHGMHSTSPKKDDYLMSAENSECGFQPMTTHSNISTPNLPSQRHDLVSERKSSRHGMRSTSPKKDDYLMSAENSECGFQPMTTHSDISTPNHPSQTNQNFDTDERNYHSPIEQEDNGRGSVATENSNGFQPMTPHSDISSPSNNTNISSEEDLRVHSLSSVNVKLRIPYNLISGTSPQSTTSGSDAQVVSDGQNESTSVAKSGSNKSLRHGSKVQNYINPNADLEDYMLGDGSHIQRELPVKHLIKNKGHDVRSPRKGYGLKNEVVKQDFKDKQKLINAKKVARSDFFIPQLSIADLAIAKDAQQDQELRNPAKVCGSDFFVPQLSPSDFLGSQKRYFSHELSDCPEISSVGSSDLLTCTESLPSVSSVTSSGGRSMVNNKELLKIACSLSKEGSGSLSPSGSETPYFSVDSPNPILEALRKKFASDSSLKTSFPNSPYCSLETLSDISVSKVNFQSTPIKTIEEIIQETGILDEPDLTLMTTELTMKPESPEKTRHYSEKSSSMQHALAMPTAAHNNTGITEGLAKTPTAGATASYAESPSMMSFLQHENSCFGDSKMEENPHLTHDNSNEQLIYEDEFGHQLGRNQPKYEYQKRTRRLWNNLEEVKTKKMVEERKKKSAENRLKMKAYSKVYNPSKKTPDH